MDDMDRHEAELLRLAAVERDSGTISFLYREHHLGDDPPDLPIEEVPQALENLKRRGWVESISGNRWRTTSAGAQALRETEDWRFVVQETFRLTGRENLFAVGVLERGVIHKRDWFRVIGRPGVLGHVISIEFARPTQGDDRIVLALDNEVATGDVLERDEPLAG